MSLFDDEACIDLKLPSWTPPTDDVDTGDAVGDGVLLLPAPGLAKGTIYGDVIFL